MGERQDSTVPSAAQGWPFLSEISSGMWLAVAGAILWANRKYFARGFDLAFDPKTRRALTSGSDDAREARRLRGAWIATAVTFFALMFWCYFLLNMSPIVMVGFFVILLALSLAITRVRAEFGTPHEIVFVKPGDTLVTLFGTKAFGDTNLIGMQSFFWFNRGYRCHPMPNFLEGFKMGEQVHHGRTRRPARPAQFLAAHHRLSRSPESYRCSQPTRRTTSSPTRREPRVKRKATKSGSATASSTAQRLDSERAASRRDQLLLLSGRYRDRRRARLLRGAFLWWPLHPAGVALGLSYAMNYFWFCVFVAWLVKLLIIRYGGMRAHKRAIPFFLGLILGDYTVGALWSLLGLLLHQPTYKIYI